MIVRRIVGSALAGAAIAAGAGAEMRQSLGTAVFFGMLGVTLFGLVFTPVFYVLVRRLTFPCAVSVINSWRSS